MGRREGGREDEGELAREVAWGGEEGGRMRGS